MRSDAPPTPRSTLAFANANPSCSKFTTSSKGSAITFPLLPTVYHSWIAKANLRCGFSSARAWLSIFKRVSQSNWAPGRKRWLQGAAGMSALRGTLSSSHRVSSAPSMRSRETWVLGHASCSLPLFRAVSDQSDPWGV